MKLLEKFFYHACAYTVAISVLFFIFAAFTDLESISISIGRYFLCLSFVAIIIGIIILGDTYINGYTPTAFLTGEILGETVYGLEALKEDGFSTYLGSVLIMSGIVIEIVYLIINIYLKKIDKKHST